jgi:hypothetical protein
MVMFCPFWSRKFTFLMVELLQSHGYVSTVNVGEREAVS